MNCVKKFRTVRTSLHTTEPAYNNALAEFNELNLQVIQQQNRIAALNQEREFRNKQLADLKIQIEDNRFQLEQTHLQIAENNDALQMLETALTDNAAQ